MERWQGSIGPSPGLDHGRGSDGAFQGARTYESTGGSSIGGEDSKARGVGGNNAGSKQNRQKIAFDYSELTNASAHN